MEMELAIYKELQVNLDYLKKLGITVLFGFLRFIRGPMDDNGYDIADYEAIGIFLASMEDMEELIAEGESDIKIIMGLGSQSYF